MTEPETRNFISQWSYDLAQGREDARDETAMQWLSVDRVAEQMRQRKEHHVEDDIDAMDFDTRAAALEAHFFHATERGIYSAGRRSPTCAKKVARARPQSASLLRRTETNATSNSSRGMSKRPRPQSATTRSGSTNATQTKKQIAWKSSAQQNPFKWREMLARGPEFKQLTLRRLEIETYELLYNTRQHQEVIDTKPTTRRRKRRKNEKGLNKPQDHSPVLACGSGLHLARSRKKRQQEHDRQMMLGKGQQSSRASEQDKAKSAKGDKQAIQDKTRQRSKLLSKKKPEKRLQVNQVLKPETQRDEPSLQRQWSTSRTARVPWVPSGSARSLAIRGITSEPGEAHLSQEERIAQLLDVFQSHTKSHLRLSKHARDRLKRAQQSAKTAQANDSRRIEHTIKCPPGNMNHPKRSRPGPTAKQSSNRTRELNAPVSQGNQENDLAMHYPLCRPPAMTVPVLSALELASETESPFSASPRTPELVIPPLKLPPNLWEYQLTNESQDGLPETPCHDQPSIALGYADTEAQSQVHSVADSTQSSANENSRDNLSTDEVVENGSKASAIEEVVRPSGEYPNELDSCEYDHDEQEITNARRRKSVTIEEGYLIEDHPEQANSGLSIQDTEASPDEFSQESQGKEVIPLMIREECGRVTNDLADSGSDDDDDLKSNSAMHTPVEPGDRDLKVSMTEGASSPIPSSEALLAVEIMMSPTTKVIGVQLSPKVRQVTVENESADTREEMSSDSNVLKVAKVVQNVDSATVSSEQKVSEEYQDLSGRSSNKSNEVDILSYQKVVDVADILAETVDSVADFQLESKNSASEEEGNSAGDRTEAAILFVPNGQEGTNDHVRDSDPSAYVTSSEMLYDPENLDILVQVSPLQQQPVTSENDSKNAHIDLGSGQPALPDTFEVHVIPAGTSRTVDTIGAVDDGVCEIELEDTKYAQRNENHETWSGPTATIVQLPLATNLASHPAGVDDSVCEIELEDMTHAQRNENHETWSDPTATIVQPALATVDTDTNLAPHPVGCPQDSARLSGTSADNTTSDIDETVVTALPNHEELTQMKLTPLVDVPASPPNDRAELLLQIASARSAHLEPASYDEIRPDSTEISRVTTEAKSPDTKSRSRSPKRKPKKPKTTAGGKSSTPKKSKGAVLESERPPSQPTAAEVVSIETIPVQVSVNDSIVVLAVGNPLRHEQEVTRSFLERVSSRKLLESESAPSRPPSCREQVERDGHLLSAELATTTTPAVVMDVESQVEDNARSVKEREDDDKSSASPLERESAQTVNDCESTVEIYPVTIEEPAISEKDDTATSFANVRDGLTFASSVADPNANPEKADPAPEEEDFDDIQDGSSGDHAVLAPEQTVSTTTENVTPRASPTESEGVDQDSTVPPPAEYRRASCKIQAQYRCYVRRRLLLDQLQFVLAKERRQARKKSRQMGRKVKTVDSVASENEGIVTALQANSADNAREVAQQGAPGSLSSEIGVEMSPRALPSKEAEPLEEDAKLEARQDSCEYAFDLFDGSKDTSGEMILESGEDSMVVKAASTNDDQQEGRATLPAEDVDTTDTNTDARTSREVLQSEEMVLQQQDPLLTSSRTELKSNHEPVPANPVIDTIAEVQPQWERYVDSTTSKSFYYNPITNETQWTTPAEQATNSFRTTPTTPHSAQAATTESTDTWQQFLDEASGQMFYYNTQTGESSWEPPAALNESLSNGSEIVALSQSDATAASAWVMYIDPASQAPYYVNVETLATSWEKPEDFVTSEPKDTYSIAVDDLSI